MILILVTLLYTLTAKEVEPEATQPKQTLHERAHKASVRSLGSAGPMCSKRTIPLTIILYQPYLLPIMNTRSSMRKLRSFSLFC